jgi:hypothetical protein
MPPHRSSPRVTPPELVELLQQWAASGVDQVVISRRGTVDPPSLELIGEQVLPAVRS